MPDKFVFEKVVYLTDTNAEGSVYFARFFDWQGMAREAFFSKMMPNAIQIFFSGSLHLITVDASIHFRNQLRLFDEVQVWVKPTNGRHSSVDLEFRYLKKQDQMEIATGKQTIAFADDTGKLIPITREVLESGSSYLDMVEKIKLLTRLENVVQRGVVR